MRLAMTQVANFVMAQARDISGLVVQPFALISSSLMISACYLWLAALSSLRPSFSFETIDQKATMGSEEIFLFVIKNCVLGLCVLAACFGFAYRVNLLRVRSEKAATTDPDTTEEAYNKKRTTAFCHAKIVDVVIEVLLLLMVLTLDESVKVVLPADRPFIWWAYAGFVFAVCVVLIKSLDTVIACFHALWRRTYCLWCTAAGSPYFLSSEQTWGMLLNNFQDSCTYFCALALYNALYVSVKPGEHRTALVDSWGITVGALVLAVAIVMAPSFIEADDEDAEIGADGAGCQEDEEEREEERELQTRRKLRSFVGVLELSVSHTTIYLFVFALYASIVEVVLRSATAGRQCTGFVLAGLLTAACGGVSLWVNRLCLRRYQAKVTRVAAALSARGAVVATIVGRESWGYRAKESGFAIKWDTAIDTFSVAFGYVVGKLWYATTSALILYLKEEEGLHAGADLEKVPYVVAAIAFTLLGCYSAVVFSRQIDAYLDSVLGIEQVGGGVTTPQEIVKSAGRMTC